MNAPLVNSDQSNDEYEMLATLEAQRRSHLEAGEVNAEIRISRLDRAIDLLVKNAEAISAAMNDDFSCRPRQVNLMTDVTGSLENLKHAKRHLKQWMKKEKRPSMFPWVYWVAARLFTISLKELWALSRPGTSR